MKDFVDIRSDFPHMTSQEHPYNVNRDSGQCLFVLVEETSSVEGRLTIWGALERFTARNTSWTGSYLVEAVKNKLYYIMHAKMDILK